MKLLQVIAAGCRVEDELGRILGVVQTHIDAVPGRPAAQAIAAYDTLNNGVWVKLRGRSGKKVPVRKAPLHCMHSYL